MSQFWPHDDGSFDRRCPHVLPRPTRHGLAAYCMKCANEFYSAIGEAQVRSFRKVIAADFAHGIRQIMERGK